MIEGALLTPAYGYVILVSVACSLFPFYLMKNVGQARKKYGVKYPAMYSDTSIEFNCIQRAHQNYLETYTLNMLFLLIGGISMPITSAIGGLIFLAGKIVYCQGYSTGVPANRIRGAFAYIGSLTFLFTTLNTAYTLLRQ